jgi:type IV secretory pathway VirB10-like protein
MNEAPEPMESPSGLDLNPTPPATARISKKVGLVAIGVVLLVGVLVVYGLYSRKEQQAIGRQGSEEKRPEPARAVGDQVVREIAPPAVANPESAPKGMSEFDSPRNGSSFQATRPMLRPPSISSRTDDPTGGRGGSSKNAAPVYAANEGEMSPEERLRLAAFRDEQQAIASPTVIRSNGALNISPSVGASSDPLQAYSALASSLGVTPKQNGSGPGGTSQTPVVAQTSNGVDGQNGQIQKEVFLEKTRARAGNDYLKSTRTEPLGKYEIKAGWDIPAILEQDINSDLPGEAKALVRSNVYDTATGKYLLVPQGSRLIGTYNSEVAYGQSRVQAVWTRIIFPDGSSINLDGMNGHDAQGRTGFHDQVDNHYPRLFGFALLTSAFAAGIELSQRQNSSLLTTPTAGQTASAAAGQQLGELGAEVTRRNLNVQPSIKIRVGYRFNVRVNRDVLFDAPYRAIEM